MLEYSLALDDAVAASTRAHAAAPAVKWTQWGFGVATAVVLGVAIGRRSGGTLPALAVAVVSLVLYVATSAWLQRRFIRNAWLKHAAGRTRFDIAVDVQERVVRIRQDARTVDVPRADVRAVADPHGVRLHSGSDLLLFIPDTAFAGGTERQAFLEQLRPRGV